MQLEGSTQKCLVVENQLQEVGVARAQEGKEVTSELSGWLCDIIYGHVFVCSGVGNSKSRLT